jgi:hypothetical protein
MEPLLFDASQLLKKRLAQPFKAAVVEEPILRLLIACGDTAAPEVDADPAKVFFSYLSHKDYSLLVSSVTHPGQKITLI